MTVNQKHADEVYPEIPMGLKINRQRGEKGTVQTPPKAPRLAGYSSHWAGHLRSSMSHKPPQVIREKELQHCCVYFYYNFCFFSLFLRLLETKWKSNQAVILLNFKCFSEVQCLPIKDNSGVAYDYWKSSQLCIFFNITWYSFSFI